MKKSQTFVTKPSLPDLKDLMPYLQKIWESKIISNNGPFHNQLEEELCKYLGVPNISLVSNGTVGLIIALQALEIKGEVITTPYSFVATAHSLMWNKLKPVFVDIDPKTLNIDPKKIKEAITKNTSAIMPVHVYGNPCDVDEIESIAKKFNLKVIYDASHAFGVKCHCGSILNHGDLSVLSFHATKVFNTFEGGAIISHSKEIKFHIDQLKNFGFTGETTVEQIGINGKMNEFSSALGLIQLKEIEKNIERRKKIHDTYNEYLDDVKGVSCHQYTNTQKPNYSYFPIFIEEDYPLTRDQLYFKLQEEGFNGRRYFYPLITDFPMYQNLSSNKKDLSVAEEIKKKVICLPIYDTLSLDTVKQIAKIISLI